jgi:gas vesicle protein
MYIPVLNINCFVFSGLRYNVASNLKEETMEDRDKKVAVAALLILAGGIVGAGVALLFAPQSGQRTRKDIVRCAKKTKNRAGEAVDDLSANISDLVESIGDKTDDLLEKGKVAAGSARKDLIHLIEEGASRLEQFRTKLSRM